MEAQPLSVIVCTHRHPPELIASLESVLTQVPPTTEIILVRSGTPSNAPFPESLGDWLKANAPEIRVVCVPESGEARARTAGMESASGDVVLFVDDDARARAGWFDAMAEAMRSHSVGAAGGTIVPVWPNGSEPRWLPRKLRVYYGERWAGPQAGHWPFATNLALRRSAAAEVGGIRSELGPRGTTPSTHSETDLCRRIHDAGYRIAEVPAAVVEHVVPPDHMRLRWVLRRAWYEGLSDATRERPTIGQTVVRLAKLGGLEVAWPFALLSPRAAVYVTARILVNIAWLTAAARRLAR